MKTTGLYGRKWMELESREQELGPPGGDEVIVKVRACGICGTDVNFLTQWEGEPMALGHELAGEVIEIGRDVRSLRVGERVVVEDCTLCGVCDACKAGRVDLCQKMDSLSGQSGLGAYLRVKARGAITFEGIEDRVACLTEPLAVCLNAVLTARVPFRGSVVVMGCGPLGLLTACVARLSGAGWVGIASPRPATPRAKARVELAEKWGFEVLPTGEGSALAEVVRERVPGGVDRVLVSAPPEALPEAVELTRYGGEIIPFGLHFGKGRKVKLDMNELIFRKITVRPFFAEPALNFRASLDLLQKGLIPAGELVTHLFGPDEAREMLEKIVSRDEPVIKAVMLPHG